MVPARWLLVLVPSSLASLAFGAPRLAEACSPPPCQGGAFVPGEDATVPVNVPGLFWVPLQGAGRGEPDPALVSLVRAADPATKLPFTTVAMTDRRAFLLVPDAPLTVGEAYVVADAAVCEFGGMRGATSRFVVSASAPLPTALGTLTTTEQVIEPLYVGTSSGSCVSEVMAAQRTITLALDPGTTPWGDVLQIQTTVDGRPSSGIVGVSGSSVDDRPVGASVRVFRTCTTRDPDAESGLTAGRHVIQMRATLAGTTMVLASTTVSVDLDCKTGNQPPVDPPIEPPVEPPVDAESGSGCTAAGGSGSLAGLGLALGALIATRRRARR